MAQKQLDDIQINYNLQKKQKMNGYLKFLILSLLATGCLTTYFNPGSQGMSGSREGEPQGYSNRDAQVIRTVSERKQFVIQPVVESTTSGRYQIAIGSGSIAGPDSRRDDDFGRVKIQGNGAPKFVGGNSRVQFMSTGGSQLIMDVNQNKDALAALNYAKSSLSSLSAATLLKCSSHVVNGIIYQFIFEFDFLAGTQISTKLKYLVQVLRAPGGKHQILKSQYNSLPKTKPKAQEFQHIEWTANTAKSFRFMEEINNQVFFQLKDLLTGGNVQLTDFDVSPPYFVCNYRVGRDGLVGVELVYDAVANVVSIVSATKKTVVQSQPTVQVKSITTTSSSSSSSYVSSSSSSSAERQVETRRPVLTSIPLVNTITTSSSSSSVPQLTTQISPALTFSELSPFSESISLQFQKLDKAEAQIRQAIKLSMEAIITQISTLSANNPNLRVGYQLVDLRFRVEGSKLMIFIVVQADAGEKWSFIGVLWLDGNYVKSRVDTGVTPQVQMPAVDTRPTKIDNGNYGNVVKTQITTVSESSSQPVRVVEQQPRPTPVTVTVNKPAQPIVNIETRPQPKPEPNPVLITVADPVETLTMVHTKPAQSSPSFSISQNSNSLLDKISGISDPALIPFLTSSQSTNSKQIEEIAKFLIEKVKITSDFSIVLVNQIKYGIRIVIQMKEDHRLFEAVLTSDGQMPQLLVWRRISVIGDADPDVFAQYYRITPDNDLQNLIRDVFKSEQMISKFRSVISAEKKITFDGIYYRIIVESTSSNRFLIVFYSIPDRKYTQIIRYELVNNNFEASKEQKFETIPEGDSSFNAARNYLLSNYAGVLRDTAISYASAYQANGGMFYRLVFVGIGGKYEAILRVNLDSSVVTICRWEKMEDGYIPVDISRLNNNDEFRSIRANIKEYIQNKFSFQAEPSYLAAKSIPGASSFYRFLFEKPFPFILSLQQRSPDHSLYIRGIQRIQIAPTSEYYNDRLFAGYSSMNPAELPYDDVYSIFFGLLQKQTQVTERNSEVVAAFRMKTPEGLYYRVVYRVNGVDYLAYFTYIFVKAEYRLESFETYQRSIEAGDYRWKCTSVNEGAKNCRQCDDSCLLTAGRCYRRIDGCSLQIASSCHTCEPGFIRTHQRCQKSPQKALPKPAPLEYTQKIIPTASGPKTISFTNGDDQNCLIPHNSGCQKCAYRFFISNGICKKVADQCDIYTESGSCLQCFSGYYLSNTAICIALDPLCMQANSQGICTRCFKNYINIQGKCYIASNIEIKGDAPRDQLCVQWNGDQCVKCEIGCYWSRRGGKCTIRDPFCEDFEDSSESCLTCQRGYRQNSGRCERYI